MTDRLDALNALAERVETGDRSSSETSASESARALLGHVSGDMSLVVNATNKALHDMGSPFPKLSKQHHREYFMAMLRTIADGGW